MGVIFVSIFCSVAANYIYAWLNPSTSNRGSPIEEHSETNQTGIFKIHQPSSKERIYLRTTPKEMMTKASGLTDMQRTLLANQIFAGRWIRFTGPVSQIIGDDTSKGNVSIKFAYLVFRPDGITTRVFLENGQVSKGSTLSIGDRITIEAQFKQIDYGGVDFEHGAVLNSPEEVTE